MVGVTGFEPATSRPPDVRATKLRYTPTRSFTIQTVLETFDIMVLIANQARIFFISLFIALLWPSAKCLFAQDRKYISASELDFPQSMTARVAFWEDIFQIYDSQTVLIHDSSQPQLILDILPFKKMGRAKGDKYYLNPKNQKQLIDRYVRRYQIAVSRFLANGEAAKNIGPIEQRVYEVFSKDRESLARLLKGNDIKIRSQRGLSDTFISAAEKAQDFLPYIENEFRAKGVPIELSRIAFVESMFNEQAVSKVGASGIFQFMRNTAQSYMIVNQLIDERNSPIKAARAAAQLFKDNFNELGNWPLAVTAYNHGRGGVAKAVRGVKSSHLPDLIKYWKGPSFGFASKNFFAEFSAARLTYEKIIHEGSISMRPTRPRLVSGTIRTPMPIDSLASKLGVSLEEILELNPCINRKIALNNQKAHLPRGFELLLPSDIASNITSNDFTINTHSMRKKLAFDNQRDLGRGEK